MAQDYWWAESAPAPAPESYVLRLAEIQRLKGQEHQPLLVVIGDFRPFVASALFKTANRAAYYRIISLADASAEELNRPDTEFILWSKRSSYKISQDERRRVPAGKHVINDTIFDCRKENVERVFARVAGRDLHVNPLSYRGIAIEKSSRNAEHDATFVKLPIAEPRYGKVYEMLVDNTIGKSLVYDIRVPFLYGHAPFAYVKFRSESCRFENINSFVKLRTTADVLSREELAVCRKFCQEIGLEYGELDVLRDKKSREIYIVDANNTPAGPPKALSIDERDYAIRMLGLAFARHVFKLDY
jgi:hypothetical protein